MAAPLKLSVIVPVGPADSAWPALLGDLSALEPDAEVLLVAPPGTAPANFASLRYGLRVPARWLEAPAGRARQQNFGAAAAKGEMLWFLHADTRAPATSIAAAQRFTDTALGYFDLRFAGDGPALVHANALGAWVRSRWLGLPFGDQGFILPRRVFEALEGFDESLPMAEDHALVWAARRAGIPVVPLRAPLMTSARRYAEQGWLRTTLRHARLTILQARQFRHGDIPARRERP
jgi:rSAM/selenodomain-associated transferase 2